MATRTSRAEPRPPRAGALHELVDILELQRPIAVGIALAVAVVGFTIAVIAPGVLPPHPIVGASVGIAAVAIGVVAAVAADAGDRTVRGVRHVRPTGAAVAAAGDEPLPQLIAWVAEQLEDSDHVRIAIVAAGTDTRSAGPLAEALGRALAYRGNRVLVADLTVEATERPGVAEVGRGELRLSQAVEFAPGVDLARVRSGASRVDALAALPRVTESIAGQVDILLAALPGLRHPGALLGSTATERSLLLAIEGVSSRVEVLAGIEALETARAPADLVILPPGVRLPAFDDAPPTASEDAGDPVGGVTPSDEPDADTPSTGVDPTAGAGPDAEDPEGADGVDEPEPPVGVDVADERGDAPAPGTGDDPVSGAGDDPTPGTGDTGLLDAEDERFEVPDAHDLAFLDGEERHPATGRAVDEQLGLLDDGTDEGTDNGTTARGGPADLGDTAELDPIGDGPEPPADPTPPAPPVVRTADEPVADERASDEPAAGAYEELQRIAAVVALERDVASDEGSDERPGGAA